MTDIAATTGVTPGTSGTPSSSSTDAYDVGALVRGLHTEGIVACRGAFAREWVAQLHEDVMAAFDEAISREGGAVGRGPNRYYVETHPEQLRGFLDLVTHPWVRTVAQAVLGDDYQIVEIGFDIPFPGAVSQPWHRDFRSPPQTYRDHRLRSLAFNVTTVDTTPDMGPFEIAVGTQWEEGADFDHGMFPPKSEYPRYEQLAQPKLPQMGDISARTALALHRGTANRSQHARPVVILGMDAPEVIEPRHDMTVTREFAAALPDDLRHHLHARVVDQLEPKVQLHTIEGLVMGEA